MTGRIIFSRRCVRAALVALGMASAAFLLRPGVLPGQASVRAAQRYGEADIAFMQGMIAHHAQALDMAALVGLRTEREDLRLLAERIDVSQKDEIAWMRRWLLDRGAAAPVPAAGHAHHGTLMPGMLTAAEMTRLEQARGPAFERLFLEGMIRHHQGALTMVAQLFGAGGGQESALFRFASDVDTDQRAEIRRMRALVERLPPI